MSKPEYSVALVGPIQQTDPDPGLYGCTCCLNDPVAGRTAMFEKQKDAKDFADAYGKARKITVTVEKIK